MPTPAPSRSAASFWPPGGSSGNHFLDQQRNASLSGTVYNDTNGNGAVDSGELGIAGVSVAIPEARPPPAGSVTTNASGAYTVSNLQAGTYSLDYTVPSGYANTGTEPRAASFWPPAAARAATTSSPSSRPTWQGHQGRPDRATAGDYLTYSLTVDNLGPSDNTVATLNDTVSAELQNATYCTGAACDPVERQRLERQPQRGRHRRRRDHHDQDPSPGQPS